MLNSFWTVQKNPLQYLWGESREWVGLGWLKLEGGSSSEKSHLLWAAPPLVLISVEKKHRSQGCPVSIWECIHTSVQMVLQKSWVGAWMCALVPDCLWPFFLKKTQALIPRVQEKKKRKKKPHNLTMEVSLEVPWVARWFMPLSAPLCFTHLSPCLR